MIALVAAGSFLVCLVVCELSFLRNQRVQSAFARILAVHFVFCAATAVSLAAASAHPGLVVVIACFWAGAFMAWFGVRSHAESSILLRMLYLLSDEPLKAEQLLEHYHAHYGPGLRVEELVKAGLLADGPGGISITAKGRRILQAARWLR